MLAHIYPEADVPVVQLRSMRCGRWITTSIAASLAPLRHRGVMIVASGNVVHNLQRPQWNQRDLACDWAKHFDDAVAAQLAHAPGDIHRVLEHSHYDLALLGLAAGPV